MNKDEVQNQMAEMLLQVLGKSAWDAYRGGVGGKAFNGDPLPTWEAMATDPAKAQIVQAWKAAGMAAVSTFCELSK